MRNVTSRAWLFISGQEEYSYAVLDPHPSNLRDSVVEFRVTFWNHKVDYSGEKVYEIPRKLVIKGNFLIEYCEPFELLVQELEFHPEEPKVPGVIVDDVVLDDEELTNA